MARLLVAVSDPTEARLLDSHLRGGGHSVSRFSAGREALSAARIEMPDLVLLDWALPDIPGGELVRDLSAFDATALIPLVVLSQATGEVDRVLAFELGAADYVTKPYSLRELSLRIAAILRRGRREVDIGRVVDLGRLKIDRAAYRVWVDGREIELTLLELNLLLALYEGRHRVQTRAALLDEVWGMDASITTRTVDTHVKRLRDKLGPLGEYVETVRGIGYRLAEIRALEAEGT